MCRRFQVASKRREIPRLQLGGDVGWGWEDHHVTPEMIFKATKNIGLCWEIP